MGTHLGGLNSSGRQLRRHASHVEAFEVNADVDLAGGYAINSDTGPYESVSGIKKTLKAEYRLRKVNIYLSGQLHQLERHRERRDSSLYTLDPNSLEASSIAALTIECIVSSCLIA